MVAYAHETVIDDETNLAIWTKNKNITHSNKRSDIITFLKHFNLLTEILNEITRTYRN